VLIARNEGLILQDSGGGKQATTTRQHVGPLVYAADVAVSDNTAEHDIIALKAILAFTALRLKNAYCKEWYNSVEVRLWTHLYIF
jgi:hypothetical protein